MHSAVGQSSPAPTTQLISLILRAFVLAYCKTIDLAYVELGKGHVNDGEDCWLDHYGLPVQMTDSANEIINVVDQAMDWLDQYDGTSP